MKKHILLLYLLVAVGKLVNAQLPINHSLYYEDAYLFNPAAIFQDEYFNIRLNTKLSYVGFENAPFTKSIAFKGPVSEKIGLGLSLLNATQGAFVVNELKTSYAYRIIFDEEHFLSMALTAGLSIYKMDVNQLVADDRDDPFIVNAAYNNKKYFITELGFLYNIKRLQFGVSAPYFFQPDYQHYIAFTSLNFGTKPGDGFSLIPSVLYQYLPSGISQVDMTIKTGFKPVWAAYSFNTSGSMLLGFGFNFKNIKLGYTYEMNNARLANIAKSNQELMLTFRIKTRLQKKTEE